MAIVFFDTPRAYRVPLHQSMQGELIATQSDAVLSGPLLVHILGSVATESPSDYWQELGIRDTIARSWDKPEEPLVIRIHVSK